MPIKKGYLFYDKKETLLKLQMTINSSQKFGRQITRLSYVEQTPIQTAPGPAFHNAPQCRLPDG